MKRYWPWEWPAYVGYAIGYSLQAAGLAGAVLLGASWLNDHPLHTDYRPWGRYVPQTEVMIHRTDPHKIYTCENDFVPDSSVNPNHYAIIDQKEALDAGYTPAGQGYCQ